MEFAWSVNNDIMEHTDLVLYFNQMAVLAIGYGANLQTGLKSIPFYCSVGSVSLFGKIPGCESLAESAADFLSKLPLNPQIGIGLFNSKNLTIKGKLLKMSIAAPEEKQRARHLIEIILSVDLGDYQLLHNNCRDYVITVAKILKEEPEFTGESWFQFENDMQSLRSVDNVKFEGGIREAPEMFKQLLKSKKSEDQDEEKN
ncbi:unnamed protein product [Clavelina lepadiformis]|uniref:PPPDE domain-containing protein n=1 Tax=Clavelina lepadiformis TaxID=159417 RepID=A0ABP0H5C8_CLALP